MTILRRFSGRAALAIVLVASAATAVAVDSNSASADTGAACSAVYTIGWQTPSDSPPDFGATVTVTNNASYTISTWSVTWTYATGQAVIAGSPYSANVVESGTKVTATPGGTYNAVLAPGASATWGFHGSYTGTSNPVPAITCSGPSQGSSSATLSGALDPLGVNTAAWDTNFLDSVIPGDMSAANLGLIRYPGGSWADQYMQQTNTVSGAVQPVNYAQFSSQVDAITGGQKFNTINYGSDTAADAAAWVRQSATAGQGATLWEIGNELYGSWETDNHTNPHTATSYATNALPYMQAMKAADPNANICYDYAMDGALAPGSGVDGWQNWNDTILQADAADISCADVHWYPINGVPTESVQSIMELIDNIPAAAAEVKTALSTYDPSASFVVGETNISQTANEWNQEPVGALFAAANSMEWLSFGAQSVDWWDVHNYGTPTADFGLLSSGSSGEPAVDTPYPPYYGYQLAAKLAVKGAKVGTLAVSTPNIYGYYSNLPASKYAVMLVNADPTNAYTVSTSSLGITAASPTEYVYSSAHPAIATSTLAGTSVSIPAESVVVLTSASGTSPTSPPTTAPPTTTPPTTAPPTTAPPTTAPPTTAPPTTAPPTTAPPSVTPSPTGGGTKTCSASYSVGSSWPGGFVAGVNVTAGTAAITGWKVTVNLPSGTAITNLWGGLNTGTTGTVQVANAAYNGQLAAGGTANFGFQANGPGTGVTVSCTPS